MPTEDPEVIANWHGVYHTFERMMDSPEFIAQSGKCYPPVDLMTETIMHAAAGSMQEAVQEGMPIGAAAIATQQSSYHFMFWMGYLMGKDGIVIRECPEDHGRG